jgi:hypothetical protein
MISTSSNEEPSALPKWLNSPVMDYEGTLDEIRQFIPTFERRAFALTQSDNERSRLNERLDTIVRLPFQDDRSSVPVGVVSKDYTFIQHTAVLDMAQQALRSVKIDPATVWAELALTEYGERMSLSLYLPEAYQYQPEDGHPMDLRLECTNSVDGSTRFRVLMGWFRLVCSNGLIIGVTRADLRRRHVGAFHIGMINSVLLSGLKDAEEDKRNLRKWFSKKVTLPALSAWIERDLRKLWGFKAATRAFHIARTGSDAEVLGPYKDNTPLSIPVRLSSPIPGAPRQARNLYDVSQILAWLAKERRDIQEQLDWREQIPDLLKPLLN